MGDTICWLPLHGSHDGVDRTSVGWCHVVRKGIQFFIPWNGQPVHASSTLGFCRWQTLDGVHGMDRPVFALLVPLRDSWCSDVVLPWLWTGLLTVSYLGKLLSSKSWDTRIIPLVCPVLKSTLTLKIYLYITKRFIFVYYKNIYICIIIIDHIDANCKTQQHQFKSNIN